MQGKLAGLFRPLFMASILGVAGFLSCLTAMRLAIRGSEVSVPNVVGRTLQEASWQLSAAELQLKVEARRFDDQIPGDRIISQNPSPESKLKKNRSVRVAVSLGAKKVQVPDLRGEGLRASQISLLKRGLAVGMISAVSSDAVEKDKVIAQDPSSQAQLATPVVDVLVSSGRKNREYLMPELTGRNLAEVTSACEGLGVSVGKVNYESIPGLLRGTVLRQRPAPGQKLAEGSSIELEVSR